MLYLAVTHHDTPAKDQLATSCTWSLLLALPCLLGLFAKEIFWYRHPLAAWTTRHVSLCLHSSVVSLMIAQVSRLTCFHSQAPSCMYSDCPLRDSKSPHASLASSALRYEGRALRCCTNPAEPCCAWIGLPM